MVSPDVIASFTVVVDGSPRVSYIPFGLAKEHGVAASNGVGVPDNVLVREHVKTLIGLLR